MKCFEVSFVRGKLWSGLKDDRIRNAARNKYDLSNNFDVLVGELRAIEQEIREQDVIRRQKPRNVRAVSAQQTEGTSTRPVENALEEINKKVKNLEGLVNKQQDNAKLLNKILDKIDVLEKECKSSNLRGPPSWDRQRT